MPYAAILFDLDGTLVSTIDAYAHAVLESLRSIGIAATKQQFDEWYKVPIHLEGILKHYGLTEEDVPTVRGTRDSLYIHLLKKETAWLPDAERVLKDVSEKYPVGIVTGSHKSYVDAIDECLGIYQYVRHVVTADDMGQFMKPHPHGLLLAADRLGVDPKDCLYVGDQTFDMVAAKAAGMKGCLVPGAYTPKEAESEAEMTVEKLDEILKVL